MAIEQNTLSLEQVTAVIEGKRVLAPPQDIHEVQNAFQIYERMELLNPYSADDLLAAHGVMMGGLLQDAGEFRSGNVGVVSHGQVIHVGTLPDYVPSAVVSLLDWVRSDETHPLIKSCIFHYEFELIHPFADGNGRMGRLWHTLLLSKWNPMFAWLPVESMIYSRQAAYYEDINQSNMAADGTAFAEFMLQTIRDTLQEALQSVPNQMSDKGIDNMSDKAEQRWAKLLVFLQENSAVQNRDVQALFEVSPATANRILATFVKAGRLIRIGSPQHASYSLSSNERYGTLER